MRTKSRIGLLHLERALTLTAKTPRVRKRFLEMCGSLTLILHFVRGGVTTALAFVGTESVLAKMKVIDKMITRKLFIILIHRE